jgi:hypothetical protein
MAHSQISVVENGNIINGRLAISTMIADDVPLFLLVTEFFSLGILHHFSDYRVRAFTIPA